MSGLHLYKSSHDGHYSLSLNDTLKRHDLNHFRFHFIDRTQYDVSNKNFMTSLGPTVSWHMFNCASNLNHNYIGGLFNNNDDYNDYYYGSLRPVAL